MKTHDFVEYNSWLKAQTMTLNIKCLGGAWTSFVMFALVNFFPITTRCLQDLFSAWLDTESKNRVLIVILRQTSRQIGSSSCLEVRWNGRTLPEIVTPIYSPDSLLHLKVFVHFILDKTLRQLLYLLQVVSRQEIRLCELSSTTSREWAWSIERVSGVSHDPLWLIE